MTDTTKPWADHLYGVDGAEWLQSDPEEVATSEWDGGDQKPGDLIDVLEWSVHPPRRHLPSASDLVNEVVYKAGEDGELVEEIGFDRAIGNPRVLMAAEELLNEIAACMAGRMANEHLATHRYVVVGGESPKWMATWPVGQEPPT